MLDEGGVDIAEERLHWSLPFVYNGTDVLLIDNEWHMAGELARTSPT